MSDRVSAVFVVLRLRSFAVVACCTRLLPLLATLIRYLLLCLAIETILLVVIRCFLFPTPLVDSLVLCICRLVSQFVCDTGDPMFLCSRTLASALAACIQKEAAAFRRLRHTVLLHLIAASNAAAAAAAALSHASCNRGSMDKRTAPFEGATQKGKAILLNQ